MPQPRGIDTTIPVRRAVEEFEMAKAQYAVFRDAESLLEDYTKQVAVTAVAYVEGSIAYAAEQFGLKYTAANSLVNQMRRPSEGGGSRKKNECRKGHDLTDPDIGKVRPDGRGRYCYVCQKEREKARLTGQPKRGDVPITNCKQGHEFTEETTHVCKKSGRRSCKICNAERQRRNRAKKKEQAARGSVQPHEAPAQGR